MGPGTFSNRRKLFVFCDGTWQDGINNNNPLTNVATLARCLKPFDNNGYPQTVYYDGGVGNVTSPVAQIIDAAIGRGISTKIRNAYSFLCHNYDFRNHSDIILVGFSRGAFAVQCLASLISQTGLLEKQYLYYLRGLFSLWAHQEVEGATEKLKVQTERLQEAGVLHQVRIKACAVWDTVSSLGIPCQRLPRILAFVGKQVPKAVEHAFQALALDEARAKFKPQVWTSVEEGPGEPNVSQCWFLGSHGDVGGNADAALGAVTLLWMIGKLQDNVGVGFKEAEIAKHLKHKYLEWEFYVNKRKATFKETRTLSTMPHSGTARFLFCHSTSKGFGVADVSQGQTTKVGWFWRFLRLKPRTQFLAISGNLGSGLMEIHFTVRLAMATNRNQCEVLKDWKTLSNSDGVRWIYGDTDCVLHEHKLGTKDYENTERVLFWKWSNDEFPPKPTDRRAFAMLEETVKDPGSKTGLEEFAGFLRAYVSMDAEIAPGLVYPKPTAP